MIVTAIAGGIWTIIVFFIGRAVGYATRSRELPALPPPPPPLPPINFGKCVCGHVMSAHEVNYEGRFLNCKVLLRSENMSIHPYQRDIFCACSRYVPEKQPVRKPTPLEQAMTELEGL